MAAKSRKKPKVSAQAGLRFRMALVSLVFLCVGGVLVLRLAYLQLIEHDRLVAQSEKQYLRTVEIQTGRGNILDRNGRPLAINIDVESVYVHPRDIVEPEQTARRIAEALDMRYAAVLSRVRSGKPFVWIKRKGDLSRVERLRQLALPGVGFMPESKRFYPQRQLAAGTIGFVGLDNQGLAGVEHARHGLLKGAVRHKVVEKDARGRYLPVAGWDERIPVRSRDVKLTIDEVVQFIAEQELKKTVEEYQARSGLVVVMDPNNGDLLAMATLPEFNPNHFSAYPREYWRNAAVSSAFEPGSIFKPIVAAAALEEKAARPEDIFFCENGSVRLGGVTIGEAENHRFGWLTLRDIIARSSNIGAIKVAQELGQKKLYAYIRKFGFGDRLGIDLPGEGSGKLRPLSEWSGLSLASISFGQEISVTPIQMAAAISAIANGGTLVRPRVTRAVLEDGAVWKTVPRQPLGRVISPETSREMTAILKAAVSIGTGKKAALAGFEVAGKTGTAQKIDPDTLRYSTTDYMASFVGFVPADDPRLTILVMVDQPRKSYWGGEVAAPVFREIARKTLRYLHVPSAGEQVYVLKGA